MSFCHNQLRRMECSIFPDQLMHVTRTKRVMWVLGLDCEMTELWLEKMTNTGIRQSNLVWRSWLRCKSDTKWLEFRLPYLVKVGYGEFGYGQICQTTFCRLIQPIMNSILDPRPEVFEAIPGTGPLCISPALVSIPAANNSKSAQRVTFSKAYAGTSRKPPWETLSEWLSSQISALLLTSVRRKRRTAPCCPCTWICSLRFYLWSLV